MGGSRMANNGIGAISALRKADFFAAVPQHWVDAGSQTAHGSDDA